MAKRGLNGQLNMFEMFGFDPNGEVEMVSLMPSDDFAISDDSIVVEEITEEVKVESEPFVEPELILEPAPEPVTELKSVSKPTKRKKEEPKTSGLVASGNGEVVMSRCFGNDTGEEAVVAYVNYNKVYVYEPEEEPILYVFDDSKAAVDFYMETLEKISSIPKMAPIAVKPRVCECETVKYSKKLS